MQQAQPWRTIFCQIRDTYIGYLLYVVGASFGISLNRRVIVERTKSAPGTFFDHSFVKLLGIQVRRAEAAEVRLENDA